MPIDPEKKSNGLTTPHFLKYISLQFLYLPITKKPIFLVVSLLSKIFGSGLITKVSFIRNIIDNVSNCVYNHICLLEDHFNKNNFYKNNKFLFGNDISMADISLHVIIMRMRDIGWFDAVDKNSFPRFYEYAENLFAESYYKDFRNGTVEEEVQR